MIATPTLKDTLQRQLRGHVLGPIDSGYDSARSLWNGLIDRHPSLIARCVTSDDVAAAVRFARSQGLSISVRGGGHQVAGHAVCEGGLMIDLCAMRGVFVDPTARTARVEGGALWADVDRQTQLFGLAVPNGYVSTTGVAGLTLGGGYGHLRGKYGLTCDSLLSAEVVLADGSTVQASEDENPDLLYALKGGGGNFGVVTAFTFRCHEVGPLVYLNAPFYPLARAREVVAAWRDFMSSAPDAFSSNALFWTVPDVDAFPASARGQTVVGLPGVWCDDPISGENVTAPLRDLGPSLLDMSGTQAYLQIQSSWDALFPHGTAQYYWKSIHLNALADNAIDSIIRAVEQRPSLQSVVPIWHFGGAMSRVPSDSTAFFHRTVPYMASFDAIWTEPDDADANIEWVRTNWAQMTEFSNGGLYVNFPGLAEEGNALARAAYGDNYERLAAIKAHYDPVNLFRMNLNIEPARRAVY